MPFKIGNGFGVDLLLFSPDFSSFVVCCFFCLYCLGTFFFLTLKEDLTDIHFKANNDVYYFHVYVNTNPSTIQNVSVFSVESL